MSLYVLMGRITDENAFHMVNHKPPTCTWEHAITDVRKWAARAVSLRPSYYLALLCGGDHSPQQGQLSHILILLYSAWLVFFIIGWLVLYTVSL